VIVTVQYSFGENLSGRYSFWHDTRHCTGEASTYEDEDLLVHGFVTQLIVIITKRRRECITAYCYYQVSFNSCVVTNFDFTTKFIRVQISFKILNYILFFLLYREARTLI